MNDTVRQRLAQLDDDPHAATDRLPRLVCVQLAGRWVPSSGTAVEVFSGPARVRGVVVRPCRDERHRHAPAAVVCTRGVVPVRVAPDGERVRVGDVLTWCQRWVEADFASEVLRAEAWWTQAAGQPASDYAIALRPGPRRGPTRRELLDGQLVVAALVPASTRREHGACTCCYVTPGRHGRDALEREPGGCCDG